ncbi:hypothetical protein SAMN04487890_113143 [Mucilaginibacter polytrichastri]|nr:hypothetical protein SAMN04487890_113143 [Mucilaginibacter polytrichastri]
MKNYLIVLYTFGIKLVFIVAECTGPTLFATLTNICVTKFLKR